MAPVKQRDAQRPSPSDIALNQPTDDEGECFEMMSFEEELKRLSAVNQELIQEFHVHEGDAPETKPRGPLSGIHRLPTPPDGISESEALAMLRMENAELKARIQELEAQSSSGQTEDVWLERQREYEMLLEEKSEVIRNLHQKIQELQENPGSRESAPVSVGIGQAEEILRLKRELEEQRRQLQLDEEDMMSQLRQMEMLMAKERAEMARQRQEMNRLQTELAREIEMASRDEGLRSRLHHLRRAPDNTKPIQAPASKPEPTPQAEPQLPERKQSGIFGRIFR